MANVPVTGDSHHRITLTILGVALTISAAFGVKQTRDGCAPEADVDVEVDFDGSGEGSGLVIDVINISADTGEGVAVEDAVDPEVIGPLEDLQWEETPTDG